MNKCVYNYRFQILFARPHGYANSKRFENTSIHQQCMRALALFLESRDCGKIGADMCRDVGCRDGAVVRALASHQCGPGSIPRSGVKCGLSLLFSSLHREVFSGYSGFPSLQKPAFDLICVN